MQYMLFVQQMLMCVLVCVVQTAECCGYPISIFFIVVNEFCERFSYYGMRGKSVCVCVILHQEKGLTATLLKTSKTLSEHYQCMCHKHCCSNCQSTCNNIIIKSRQTETVQVSVHIRICGPLHVVHSKKLCFFNPTDF